MLPQTGPHGNRDMALLTRSTLARLKCQIFLTYFGNGGTSKLILQKVIWCFIVGSGEGRTPLLRPMLGWSVTKRSIHEGLQPS